jgi:hypothetical protein
MKITPDELILQLSRAVDPTFARAAVDSFVEMHQRYWIGDWKPSELDAGRLCEAVARSLLQLDTGTISHHDLPGSVCDTLKSKKINHNLDEKDRDHICRVIATVYKFRSDRGSVHISPIHTPNAMDAMLVLHAGKWIFAELLRIAWVGDRKIVGETIAQLVQLEHSIIHELDGRPMVLVKDISAPEEVLLLLNHAPNNRMSRQELRELSIGKKPQNVTMAISRLITSKEIRDAGNGEVALTPLGQKRVMNELISKYAHAD